MGTTDEWLRCNIVRQWSSSGSGNKRDFIKTEQYLEVPWEVQILQMESRLIQSAPLGYNIFHSAPLGSSFFELVRFFNSGPNFSLVLDLIHWAVLESGDLAAWLQSQVNFLCFLTKAKLLSTGIVGISSGFWTWNWNSQEFWEVAGHCIVSDD